MIAGRPMLFAGLLWAVSGLLIAGLSSAAGDLNLPAPLIAPIAEPAEPPVTAPGRVLFVVVDGLRADVAEPLFTRPDRARARQLWADAPTFSTAQYVALFTGVPPRDSGVRTNDTIRAAGLDDVAARVLAGGRTTAVISDEVDWWHRLFPKSFSTSEVTEPGHELLERAHAALPSNALVLVHLVETDHQGHSKGGASADYRAAAERAARTVDGLASAWPGAVVIVADHGHRPEGGHGGDEADVSQSWLVAWGPGVKAGAQLASARSVDVAPTLSALLGVPAPAQAQGRTLVDLLELTDDQRRQLEAADAKRQARVARATLEGRGEREMALKVGRAIRAVLALLFLAAVARFARRHSRAVLAGGGSLAASALIFWVGYGLISFSASRTSGRWVGGAAVISAVTALVAMIAVGRRAGSPAELAQRITGVVLGAAPLALLFFVLEGILESRLTCEPGWLAAGPIYGWLTLAPATLLGALACTFASARRPR